MDRVPRNVQRIKRPVFKKKKKKEGESLKFVRGTDLERICGGWKNDILRIVEYEFVAFGNGWYFSARILI